MVLHDLGSFQGSNPIIANYFLIYSTVRIFLHILVILSFSKTLVRTVLIFQFFFIILSRKLLECSLGEEKKMMAVYA